MVLLEEVALKTMRVWLRTISQIRLTKTAWTMRPVGRPTPLEAIVQPGTCTPRKGK